MNTSTPWFHYLKGKRGIATVVNTDCRELRQFKTAAALKKSGYSHFGRESFLYKGKFYYYVQDLEPEEEFIPNILAIKEWIEALESGNYTQAFMYLRFGNDFCCLGVGCDLAKTENFNWRKSTRQFYYFGDENEHSQMPYVIREHYGISKELAYELWQLNDAKKYSFKKIAKILRKRFTIP